MRRRAFLADLGMAAASSPAARAQPSPRGVQTRSVALLRATAPQERDLAAFESGLAEHGWRPGHNLRLDARYAGGNVSQLPRLASELIALRPEVLVVDGNLTARVVRDATARNPIPIVFAAAGDPVVMGFVASLARPGGYMTGVSNIPRELTSKRVEILKDAFPKLTRLAILVHPANNPPGFRLQDMAHETARLLGIEPFDLDADTAQDLDTAPDRVASLRADGLVAVNSPLFYSERARIVGAVNRIGLPAIYAEREFTEVGGLMSYGVDFVRQWRRMGFFVDRILRGTPPGDLPVENPTRLEFVINTLTARTAGFVFSASAYARADEVIE